MAGKLCMKQPTNQKGNLGTIPKEPVSKRSKDEVGDSTTAATKTTQLDDEIDISLDSQEAPDAWLDELHLPDAEPGQHFHADFGFVRGSEFSLKLDNGKTIMSINGKNSYLIVVDRATRMIWANVRRQRQWRN